MKQLLLFVFLLVFGISLHAQIIKPIIFKRGKAAYVEHLMDKKKKNRKYAMSKFSSEFDHFIHLNNDSVVNSNSDIMMDTKSGKYHLYYLDSNSMLRKIYPEDTKFIAHSNPYDDELEILGYPTATRWLFTLNEGKISTFAYSCTAKRIDFYSINDGELQDFENGQGIAHLLKNNKKAYALLQKKEYYKAIYVYNKTLN